MKMEKKLHDLLYNRATAAIQELFSDTTVSIEETERSLLGLVDEIETALDCLNFSGEKKL